jgi:hypothetical protein
MVPAQLQDGGDTVVFGRQQWYLSVKGDEETFRGVLKPIPGAGRGSRSYFTLVMSVGGKDNTRDLFVANNNRALAGFANRRVTVVGMAIDLKVGGRMRYEIWPASIRVGGGGPAVVVGPGDIGGDVGVIAQTGWEAPFPAQARIGAGQRQLVARSQAQLNQCVGGAGNAARLLQALGLKQIDFRRNMVILFTAGVTPSKGYTCELVGLDPVDINLVVRWAVQEPQPGTLPARIASHPGRVIVIPKMDGVVRFSPPAR